MDAEQQRRDANKVLAELLGWRVERRTEPSYQGQDTFNCWQLIRPDGYMAWYPPPLMGTGEVEACWAHVPNFYGSVDACLAVLPEDAIVGVMPNWNLHSAPIKPPYDGYYATLHVGLNAHRTDYAGTGATRAEALADATLAWAQAQHAAVAKGES